jgi:hypothetical protein
MNPSAVAMGVNSEGKAGRNLGILDVRRVTRCRRGSTFNGSISNGGSPNPVALLPRYNYKACSQSHFPARFMYKQIDVSYEMEYFERPPSTEAGRTFQLHLFEHILERMPVVTSGRLLQFSRTRPLECFDQLRRMSRTRSQLDEDWLRCQDIHIVGCSFR